MHKSQHSSAPGSCLLAVGTYTEILPHVQGCGLGIHLLEFDGESATFRERQILAGPVNPSYLCAWGDRLYSVSERSRDAALDISAIEDGGARLRPIGRAAVPGADPCHVSVNPVARQLYVSNYSSGELLCYALDDKGLPAGEPQALRRQGSGPRADRQDGPHAHFAMPDAAGAHVYLCDLGTDAIVRHRVQADGLAPEPDWTLRARPGSGPRHLVLAGALIVAVNELSNTLSVYGQAEDARTPPRELAHASTLPPGWTGASWAAALRLHPNGRLLMVSNRGHDSIAAFRLRRDAPWLEPLGHFPAGGRTPRDIAFTPDGAFLLIASQDDHLIRALRIDPVTGMPERAGASFALRSPVSLCPLLP